MTHSLNEIEALCKKAARGAGLSWGMAEEAGRAARWLASMGLAGPDLLAGLLTQNDPVDHAATAPAELGAHWQAAGGRLCPLAAGAALNDCGARIAAGAGVTLAQVSHPLLLAPFAAWVALFEKVQITLSWAAVTLTTDGAGLWVNGPDAAATAPVTLRAQITTQPPRGTPFQPSLRGRLSRETESTLGKFAHRTYAPATEASRLLGAGAGVSDND